MATSSVRAPARLWPTDYSPLEVSPPGWRPLPFREFIVKLHNRCNLRCDYCYMYELADQSWRQDASSVMSDRVVDQTCRRIAEHVAAYDLPSVQVVLHGGEPLLAPHATARRLVTTLRGMLPAVTFSMQTNGVGLTEERLAVLAESGVRIGVSLDGGQQANDRHRLFANGRSSFAAVDAALRRLRHHPDVYAGILTVIDIRNHPVETYEHLLSYAPPAMDLLLPHGHWSARPPLRPADDSTPYGDWLVAVFDRWYDAPIYETRVRIFEEIMSGLLGGPINSEVLGLAPVQLVVVDVDGTLEQVDTLRAAYEGAPDTGLNVFDHPFDAAFANPAVVARQIGLDALSSTCRACPVHRICGGGYYPHRFRDGHGFRNPSVYSADLRHLIEHIATRLSNDISRLRGRTS